MIHRREVLPSEIDINAGSQAISSCLQELERNLETAETEYEDRMNHILQLLSRWDDECNKHDGNIDALEAECMNVSGKIHEFEGDWGLC